VSLTPRKDAWRRTVDGLARWAALFSALMICLIALLIVADVARRNLAGSSIPGAVEAAEVLLVTAVFLGLAFAEYEGAHVRTSIIVARLRPRVRHKVTAFSLLIMCLALVWLTWASADKAIESFQIRELRTGLIEVPIWPARIALSLGYFLLLLQAAAGAVDAARGRSMPWESDDLPSQEEPAGHGGAGYE
jgi:TRAP-type mannitol/chloroaromatic compound transport system permease small subunit